MNEETQTSNISNTILKELSDIKVSMAVNTNDTANIKSAMGEIRVDIKEIKNDFVSRREFTDALLEVRNEIHPIRKLLWLIGSTVVIALIGSILRIIIK